MSSATITNPDLIFTDDFASNVTQLSIANDSPQVIPHVIENYLARAANLGYLSLGLQQIALSFIASVSGVDNKYWDVSVVQEKVQIEYDDGRQIATCSLALREPITLYWLNRETDVDVEEDASSFIEAANIFSALVVG